MSDYFVDLPGNYVDLSDIKLTCKKMTVRSINMPLKQDIKLLGVMFFFWQDDIMIWQVDINNWQVNIKIWQVDTIIWQVMVEICPHSYVILHVFCFLSNLWKLLAEHTQNAIGQCTGWLSVWYANSIEFEDPFDTCTVISCKNLSLLVEAKCHAVRKMILRRVNIALMSCACLEWKDTDSRWN